MKTIKFSLILLAFMAFAQTTWAQLPCLPGHGETEDQSAWCGDVFQTIALEAGTNWVSFNVDITLDELKAALWDALNGTVITIKSQDGSTSSRANGRWTGSIEWNLGHMYKIVVVSACEITLSGIPVNPANHPVTIVNGANWIAFPFATSMTLTNAFAGFAINGDQVKSQESSSIYRNGWRGDALTELVPGQGYIYQSNSSQSRTLIFPTSAKH